MVGVVVLILVSLVATDTLHLLQCGPIAASVSDMEDFDEDEETLAAIDRGIKAADEGRTVSLEEVRKMISEWTRKFEARKQR